MEKILFGLNLLIVPGIYYLVGKAFLRSDKAFFERVASPSRNEVLWAVLSFLLFNASVILATKFGATPGMDMPKLLLVLVVWGVATKFLLTVSFPIACAIVVSCLGAESVYSAIIGIANSDAPIQFFALAAVLNYPLIKGLHRTPNQTYMRSLLHPQLRELLWAAVNSVPQILIPLLALFSFGSDSNLSAMIFMVLCLAAWVGLTKLILIVTIKKAVIIILASSALVIISYILLRII